MKGQQRSHRHVIVIGHIVYRARHGITVCTVLAASSTTCVPVLTMTSTAQRTSARRVILHVVYRHRHVIHNVM